MSVGSAKVGVVPRILLAVDGNSLVHRAFHAQARTAFRCPDGRPGWAVRGLLEQLVAAADRSCADAVVVGFDDPSASVRRDTWPGYKAQRPEKLPSLVRQLDDAARAVSRLGVQVVVPTGLEADDVLASAAHRAAAAGWNTVIATSDRDAFALIDETTRVLRIINGGVGASPMLDPTRLVTLTGVTPAQYLDLAALRGDPSDNLPGVPGIGPTLGARLLASLGSAENAFADAAAGGERCRPVVGPAMTARLATEEARRLWEFNREVMVMRHDVAIPGEMFQHPPLPLPRAGVSDVFADYDLPLRTALAVLCGDDGGTAPRHIDLDPAWRPRPVVSAPRHPPLRRARPLQETLF